MRTESMPAGIAFKTEKPDHRGGFTLVELLVVIMIIALLAAIVTPAVMRAMASSRAAAVKSEIEMLHMALMNYKNEYGAFPPADMRGLWNGTSVNTSHAAYKHLKRIFPRISEFESNNLPSNGNRSPYYFMAQMSPPQALVFWLQGFYDNPQFPLTSGIPLTATDPRSGDIDPQSGVVKGPRKKFFDFDAGRLYAASPYFQAAANAAWGSPQVFSSRNGATGFARDYPVYFPNQPNAGLPYVYFPSLTYSVGPAAAVTAAISSFAANPPVFYYHATGLNGDTSYASPYFSSLPQPQPAFAQLHVNPDTFQLIAAGADGIYAAADTNVAAFPGALALFTFNGQSIGPLPSVSDPAGAAAGHEDNITNFAAGPLKAAALKLLNP